MTRDPNVVYDGTFSMELGMDSGRPVNLLPRNQAAFFGNATVRGGYPHPRPGRSKINLEFLESDGDVDTALRDVFQDGLFQGAIVYNSPQGPTCVIAQIGGRTFRLEVGGDNSVMEITIAGDQNPPNRRQSWLTQAEDFLIIQDGQSPALIYNGDTMRRAVKGEVPEVPVGTVMAYVQGRLWVTLPDRRQFVASDLVGDPTGTSAYNRRDAILKFSSNTFLNEGGAFSVPANLGGITAMAAIANLDTSLGQGPLQVFTSDAVFSVNAPADRDIWKNLTYPIQTVSLIHFGACSQFSVVNVNGDLWYRAKDGIRSFLLARRDFGTWGNTPMSNEMARVLDYDQPNLWQYSSAVLFDNRLLMTSSSTWNQEHGTSHRGIVALDFDLISSMRGRLPPAYDGFWTSTDVLQILKGDFNGADRCFMFVLNDEEKIELWEQHTGSHKFDQLDGVTDTLIHWFIEFPSMDCAPASGRGDLKMLEGLDVWIDRLTGTAQFDLKYRPDQFPCWVPWKSWQKCSKYQICDADSIDGCLTLKQFKEQYRPRTSIPQPENLCNSVTSEPFRNGFEFQLRLDITGYCQIIRTRLKARIVEENPSGPCPAEEEVCIESVCDPVECNESVLA